MGASPAEDSEASEALEADLMEATVAAPTVDSAVAPMEDSEASEALKVDLEEALVVVPTVDPKDASEVAPTVAPPVATVKLTMLSAP